MPSKLLTLTLAAVLLFACGCTDTVTKPKTKDPLEARTYDFLEIVKVKNWDAAYAFLSEEARKYYPKEQFVEKATTHILPKVDAVYVTRIEKRKLDATVFTQFKPKSAWATYNSMESAKIKLEYTYKDGKWFITYPEIIAKGIEEEQKENARKERVAKWKPLLNFSKFRVENKITDEGPMLVFHGEVENTGTEAVEMVMMMVEFFDGQGKKVYQVVFVPIYISAWEEKVALAPKSKQVFESSVSSEIPDTWSGKIEPSLFDAGDMPAKQ